MRVAERRTQGKAGGSLGDQPPSQCLRVPVTAGTVAGLRDWAQTDDFPETGKISLINGRLSLDMSPDELETHNKVKHAIDHGVATVNEEDDLGEYFVDGALVTNSETELGTIPDGTFVTWETSRSGRVSFVPRRDQEGQFVEIRGTPDWVLEVVSFSTVVKDTIELPVSYYRAGIGEFWLIDARGQDIDFHILVRRRGKYGRSKARDGWTYSPLFRRWFRLARHLNRAGRWNYRLEMKR
jgi:Uma2 family endonuclease